jgi:hypothetical protein
MSYIFQVHIHLCIESTKGQTIFNIFLVLLQLVSHQIHQNMGLGIDIVYVNIQNTIIPMQHVYPNIYVGGGFGSQLNHM